MYNFQCDFSPFQAGSFLDLSKKLKEKITQDEKNEDNFLQNSSESNCKPEILPINLNKFH